MRKFQTGDVVYFRKRVSTGLSYGIQSGEKGTVIAVEDHSQTEPLYKIQVKFGEQVLPYTWSHDFEFATHISGRPL